MASLTAVMTRFSSEIEASSWGMACGARRDICNSFSRCLRMYRLFINLVGHNPKVNQFVQDKNKVVLIVDASGMTVMASLECH
jgi:hypothetical protein